MHSAADRPDGWCPEDDSKLIELRAQGLPWKEIAWRINHGSTCVNRTADACSGRYRKIVPHKQRSRFYNTHDRWSSEDEERLARMMRQRMKPREIAAAIGKSSRAVHNKINYVRNPRHAAQIDTDTRVWAPPHLLEDRDRRMMAERSITAFILGDPAPVQSALDKKQGAFA